MHGQLLPFPQPVFLGQGKREETGRKIRPPLPQFLTGTPFFCEVGALTVVTFAHITIIALLWKTEPDLNATFINFTNTKRLLNMRQVFLNMTSRRLWQSEIDGFKSLLGWKMPLEILSPAGLRFMPYGSNQNANFLPLATCWIWALQEDTPCMRKWWVGTFQQIVEFITNFGSITKGAKPLNSGCLPVAPRFNR